jgi:nicotinamidase-related amidase
MLYLAASKTALILVDLQEGIVNLPILAPRSGQDVVAASKALAGKFRAAAAPVVLVNVAWAVDGGDALKQEVDRPIPHPPGGLSANFSKIIESLAEPCEFGSQSISGVPFTERISTFNCGVGAFLQSWSVGSPPIWASNRPLAKLTKTGTKS